MFVSCPGAAMSIVSLLECMNSNGVSKKADHYKIKLPQFTSLSIDNDIRASNDMIKLYYNSQVS